MRLIAIAFLALVLTGCSFFNTKPIEVSTTPIERIPLVLPEADRIYARDFDWIIITPENADKIFKELGKKGQPVALIGVTGDDYEILTLSNADKLQLITQLRAQINAYKNYYLAIEKRDAEHNQKLDEE